MPAASRPDGGSASLKPSVPRTSVKSAQDRLSTSRSMSPRPVSHRSRRPCPFHWQWAMSRFARAAPSRATSAAGVAEPARGGAAVGKRLNDMSLRSPMTVAGTGIGKPPARSGDELPIVAVRLERELEDAVHGGACRTVWMNDLKVVQPESTGADVELGNAVCLINGAIRRHGLEALVIMLLAVQDDVYARRVQGIPDRLVRGVLGP